MVVSRATFLRTGRDLSMLKKYANTLILFVALFPGLTVADTGALVNTGNTAWVFISTILVLFMVLPGLFLFYGGLVRSKNVLSVSMQTFVICCMVSLLWLIFGYSLVFTDPTGWFGGLNKAFFAGVFDGSMFGDIPESAFALYQMVFAIFATSLVVVGFAERMRFPAIVAFCAAWLLFVYVPVAHWVRGDGWLAQMGVMDFAGGSVVLLTAGVGALAIALFLGKRRGFPTMTYPPHNMTMTITGAGILWIGWFGFNGGNALAADGQAGMTLLVTQLSAASAVLCWMVCEWLKFHRPSALGMVLGLLGGLVAITPGAGYVGPAGAMVIGALAGIASFYATVFIKWKFEIDDPFAFTIFGVGTITGMLLTGFFASDQLSIFSGTGLGEGVSISGQMGTQFVGMAVISLYTLVFSWVILKALSYFMELRVTVGYEAHGLDLTLYHERGYDL